MWFSFHMGRPALADRALTMLPAPAAQNRDGGGERAWVAGMPVAATAAVAAVAGTLVLAGAVQAERPQRLLLQAVVVGVPVIAGSVARRSARTRRFGTILVGIGLVWALTLLAESPHSLPYSAGRVVGWLTAPLVIYLMLAFPDGRLAPGRDRALFGAIVVLVTLLYLTSALLVEVYPSRAPWATCRTGCPPNAFLILDREPAAMAAVVQPARELISILLLGGVTLSLAWRMGTATPLRRRTIAPVVGMGMVSTAVLAGFLTAGQAAPDGAAAGTLGVAWSLCIPGIAAAFLVGLVRRRLFVADALGRLSATLGGELDPSRLRAALASAVGDATLEVRWWDDERRDWGPTDRGHAPPPHGAGRVTMQVDDGGSPVALLSFDEALYGDDELLEAVGAHTLAALRHARVTRELKRSLAERDDSRSRIATAAAQERARIERDLHDGAQQRLVALRVKLSIAEELLRTDPAAGSRKLHELGLDIDHALDDVRSLAQGIYPSTLADRGIEDALRSVVRGSPLPSHLTARGLARHPVEIESAVYFACLEAAQNAVKHARGATGVWITLREDGAALAFEVRDDGVGFAARRRGAGGGLRNMADRLEAVGGRLTVESAPGRGTRIVGAIPLRPR
ncbi:MAG: histidine kinase [Solirubrobacteraceae bacterium]|nr:histidine kinase [Solirubrobacteraceae bacterium]